MARWMHSTHSNDLAADDVADWLHSGDGADWDAEAVAGLAGCSVTMPAAGMLKTWPGGYIVVVVPAVMLHTLQIGYI